MNIRDVLHQLSTYYLRNRGAGHTRAQNLGIHNTDCAVLCHDQFTAQQYNKRGLVLGNLPRALLGVDKALVIEHEAMRRIFVAALEHIDMLESRVEELEMALSLVEE